MLASMAVTWKQYVLFWHFSEEALWSAHDAVSGPTRHLLFVAL
jgi:hypothetical protein